jgi:D-alanyl-D-alanine dipeptidase
LYYALAVRRAVLIAMLTACAHATAGTRDKPGDLVELAAFVPDAVIDMRYATADNFTKTKLYPVARCMLRRAVATRLARAAVLLRKQERRLLVWDCYRPRSIQEVLWKQVPDERYVANPAKGSRHNRGAAIDIGLVDKAGDPVSLPTAFDDFTEAAHRDHALEGERGVEARRLEAAMTAAGFVGLPTEWWHFDAPDASSYPLADEPL